MTSRLGRLAGALSLLALLVLVAASLASATSPPAPVSGTAQGKLHRVGQTTPHASAQVNSIHVIGYRLVAKLSPASGTATGEWMGILIQTNGVVHTGTLPSIPGCTVTGPRAVPPGQAPPRQSGIPTRIKCGGPVPPFSVPPSGTHWILGWRETFSGLSGPATGTDLQLNSPGAAGTVAASLCAPCTSGKFGRTNLTGDQAAAVLAGNGYIVVKTAANPSGEISGQITKAAPTAAATLTHH